MGSGRDGLPLVLGDQHGDRRARRPSRCAADRIIPEIANSFWGAGLLARSSRVHPAFRARSSAVLAVRAHRNILGRGIGARSEPRAVHPADVLLVSGRRAYSA